MLAGGSLVPFARPYTRRCLAPRSHPTAPGRVGSAHAHARVCKPKHRCVHVHVISQLHHHHRGTICLQIPTRGTRCVTHVGPIPAVGVSVVGMRGRGICTRAWLRAGAQRVAAPGALQRREQGRAGGTCPSHSNSIPAAAPAEEKTPGYLCLLAVLSPPAQEA